MFLLKRKKSQLWLGIKWGAAVGAIAQALLLSSGPIPAAHAQTITDDDVTNYARAIVDIEAQRISAYEEASDLLASIDSELSILDVPLSCSRSSLSDMPDVSRADRVALRTILVNFCNGAIESAELNDLTPKRFNSITASHREDSELADRIKDAIRAL